MSDKSKVSYYFTRKPEIPLQELCNARNNSTVHPDIVNINETVVLNRSNGVSICSSTSSIFHDQNEICQSRTSEDLLTAPTTDRSEPSIPFKIDS
ncbi:unnamed protein product [Rotaria sp. Silwood2]|nr:unnamed protein product [Rotaria sp. Silwood2]CAF3144777.1 unnamed protein product [Rotaria sp. Silwood2]CAF3343583.1 unnamed protein product [Rotaria sp. Silwood2]CAF4119938.1 unnamed protein product [Rotaria sp. Silwood2]CAF4392862.1 unnamed protein product [Rotaria sp. Silwood2]